MKEAAVDPDMLENEYRNNKRFRSYVDRYCKGMNVTAGEALTHEIVRQVCISYAEDFARQQEGADDGTKEE